MAETASWVTTGIALLVAVVGAIDAGGEDLDSLAMFSAIAALLVVGSALRRARPPCVGLRPDLSAWLRYEAARTDDTPGRIADRAFAAYRAVESASSGADSPP